VVLQPGSSWADDVGVATWRTLRPVAMMCTTVQQWYNNV
jgi:hypothetical protein